MESDLLYIHGFDLVFGIGENFSIQIFMLISAVDHEKLRSEKRNVISHVLFIHSACLQLKFTSLNYFCVSLFIKHLARTKSPGEVPKPWCK